MAKPLVLDELIDELIAQPNQDGICLGNALFCLIQLGAWKQAQQKLVEIRTTLPPAELVKLKTIFELIDIALIASNARSLK